MGTPKTSMKSPVIRAAKNSKNLDEGQYLTSWKEIADYMRSSVRTVQRYERESGLPIRRPTGKSRGAVFATRAEIDAWVAAGPIRETFTLTRTEHNALLRNETDKLENGLIAMRKLKTQMLELRIETRSAMNLFMDRLSAVHSLLPPGPRGHEPLTNLDLDMVTDKGVRGRGTRSDAELNSPTNVSCDKHGETRHYKTSFSTVPKPH